MRNAEYDGNLENAANAAQVSDTLYIAAGEDILCGRKPEDAEAAARAVEEGYLVRREDGRLSVTVPAFTREQKAQFDALVVKHFAPLMEEYSEAVDRFAEGYRKLFPAHLNEDVDRMCRGIFEGLYENIVGYAQRTGEIGMPSPGCVLDVLVQRE